MSINFQIKYLSNQFFQNYPITQFPELVNKSSRPYNSLVISGNAYHICIPYRSEIKHKNGFLFKSSNRAKTNVGYPGLDYSKLVIIYNINYIDPKHARIDKDEYISTKKHIEKIAKNVQKYINDYIEHHRGIKIIKKSEYERKYLFSTLQHFHKELNI